MLFVLVDALLDTQFETTEDVHDGVVDERQ